MTPTMPGPPTGHLGRTLGLRPLLRPAWVWLGAREQAGWPVGYAWASLADLGLQFPGLPAPSWSFFFLLFLVVLVLRPSPTQSSSPPAMQFIFAAGQEPSWEAMQDSGWTCNVVC